MTSGGNNFNHFAENQLTKFSSRDAGDFSDVMAPKCGSLPRDAGDLVGLYKLLVRYSTTRPLALTVDPTLVVLSDYRHVGLRMPTDISSKLPRAATLANRHAMRVSGSDRQLRVAVVVSMNLREMSL